MSTPSWWTRLMLTKTALLTLMSFSLYWHSVRAENPYSLRVLGKHSMASKTKEDESDWNTERFKEHSHKLCALILWAEVESEEGPAIISLHAYNWSQDEALQISHASALGKHPIKRSGSKRVSSEWDPSQLKSDVNMFLTKLREYLYRQELVSIGHTSWRDWWK